MVGFPGFKSMLEFVEDLLFELGGVGHIDNNESILIVWQSFAYVEFGYICNVVVVYWLNLANLLLFFNSLFFSLILPLFFLLFRL